MSGRPLNTTLVNSGRVSSPKPLMIRCDSLCLGALQRPDSCVVRNVTKEVHYFRDHTEKKFAYRDPDGRRFTTSDLRNPGVRPNLQDTCKGYEPHPNGWAVSRKRMEQYDRDDRLYFPQERSGHIRLKRYLDERPGHKVQNLWTDLSRINSQAKERLGYPTQKPRGALQRIIKTSSDVGDIVLDPFCGCGMTIDAARRLNRRWAGIDIASFAIDLIKDKRLRDPGIATKVIPKDDRVSPQAGSRKAI